MKKPDATAKLEANNLKRFREQVKSGSPLTDYTGLVALVCDVADTAIGGMDCYLTFGCSRDKSNLLCTVTIGSSKLYAGGTSLVEVSTAAEGLL